MIHIAYCFDKHYRAHFGASVTSLLINSLAKKSDIFIHVLTDDVDQDLEDSLNKLKCVFGVNINTYVPTAEQLQNLFSAPLFSHVSLASYFRLLLPKILPLGIDRLLYLDSDTIVLADIEELYDRDLDGCTLAGELDRFSIDISMRLSLKNTSIPGYYCSIRGVG